MNRRKFSFSATSVIGFLGVIFPKVENIFSQAVKGDIFHTGSPQASEEVRGKSRFTARKGKPSCIQEYLCRKPDKTGINPVDVAAILGHVSLDTTARHCKPSEEKLAVCQA